MLSDAPILRATFIILSALSPLTTYNLGATSVCHPDLLQPEAQGKRPQRKYHTELRMETFYLNAQDV